MDADSNSHCLLCNTDVGSSDRNAIEIFNNNNKLPCSNKTVDICLSEFTKQTIEPDNVDSKIICRRCFKLLEEYDMKMSRVEEIKEEFKKNLQKISSTVDNYPHEVTIASTISISDKNVASKFKNCFAETNKTINAKKDRSKSSISDMKNISPVPSNLVIVGPHGKKIQIQKMPQPSPSKSQVPIKISHPETSDAKKNAVTFTRKMMPIKSTPADSKKKAIYYETQEELEEEEQSSSMYLSETDGVIIKTEKQDLNGDENDEFVFRELEIVDDDIAGIPLEEGSIFMEQAEDGSIIRVVSGSNIIQDEHGNYIYNPDDNTGIEMILSNDADKEMHLKDTSRSLLKSNSSKKEGDDDDNDILEDMEIDAGCVSIDDPIEAQMAAFKGADNLYTCLICEMEETENAAGENENSDMKFLGDSTLMMEHMRTVHNTDIFICDTCGEVFLSRDVLQEHIGEHLKSNSGIIKCELCSKFFKSEALLKRHQKVFHWRVKSMCTICNKKFSGKAALEQHANVHKEMKPYICPVCGKTFSSKYTFNSHLKTHTDRPRPFTCTECGKSFFTFTNLTQHEKTHLGIKNFLCKTCGKSFGTQHNLDVHGLVHSGLKRYTCETCGKAFARRAEIKDHERIHTGEKPYVCEICNHRFAQRSNLQSHKRAAHFDDKRYKCSQCEKCFKRRRLLEYHVKAVHTGERPHRCAICDATFVYPEHFKKHQKIHTGEKPYKCEVCGKRFNSRDNRNAHRYIHSDKKPYECLECGAGFMRKPLLYAHMHSQGHVSDTIIVNQPRVGVEVEGEEFKFIIESVKEEAPVKDNPRGMKNISTLNASQSKDDSGMLNKNESILPDNIYLEENTIIDDDMLDSQRIEIIDGEHEVIESEDGSIRLVQLKMPDGENAWVALND